MEIWQAIVLGLVQGITEFLPVSSSGHLIVCERWLGVEGGLFFGVMLHVGTLIPLVAVYLKKILELFRPPFRKLGLLALASLPAALAGFLLGDWIDEVFFGGTYVIFGFLLTAVLLAAAERRYDSLPEDLTPQALEQQLLRVFLVLLGRLGQQTAAFDLQKQRRHGHELAGLVHVEIRRGMDGFDVLLRDFADENILQVDLGLADQVE